MTITRCPTCGYVHQDAIQRCKRCHAKISRDPQTETGSIRQISEADTDQWGLPEKFLTKTQDAKPKKVSPNPRRAPSRRLPRKPTRNFQPNNHIYLISPLLGEPFKVTDRTIVTIGRGRTSTLLFPVKSVSRCHARILYRDNHFIIEDLGSTNGTFLNSEPIQGPRKLEVNTRILIGPFEILVVKDKPQTQQNPSLDPKLLEGDTRLQNSTPWTVTADLTHITVMEIVQVLALNKRTGKLVFQSQNEAPGLLCFSLGTIVHAKYKDLEPLSSALQLLLITQGWVSFLATEDLGPHKTLTQNTQSLLVEAMRLQDEAQQESSSQGPAHD